MLTRKQSIRGTVSGAGGTVGTGGAGGEPVLADYGPDDAAVAGASGGDLLWVNQLWLRRWLRLCALLSLVSVGTNTPKTFDMHPTLVYVTFVIDVVVGVFLAAEMFTKMYARGVIWGETPYLKNRWCQFDGIMVVCLIGSIALQVFEMTGIVDRYSYWCVIRSPRPLILIRVFRFFLKFQLPKTRIESIFKRSSQQIFNVTIFFLFFMSLYGILGVQFFGEINYHCVKNGTDPDNVTVKDLMIPDTYCSPEGASYSGRQCPRHMVCMALKLSRRQRGFNGFDEFATSFFTVYVAASQEGWVFIMYRTIDSLPSWRGFFFFISMIFFLSWMVKNVFIAVIIETFAEIRVQFQQMWGSRGGTADSDSSQVLHGDAGEDWRMVTLDESSQSRASAPSCCQRALKTAAFHILSLLLVLANAVTMATVHFRPTDNPHDKIDAYYYAEVAFTVVFAIEALFKLWCYGFRSYFRRSLHKVELLLAVGTSLHVIPIFYRTHFTYFQVMRVVRLIKASPMLEDFCWKIFGPGKKLGSLVLFTTCLLIITSCVSLQLFCSIKDFHKFETFPQAFMRMFQILTQEGWVDIMDETMSATSDSLVALLVVATFFVLCHSLMTVATMSMFQILTQKGWNEVMHLTMFQTGEQVAPFVAIYFIFYHLFVTLIVVSLFVAVILDNLELDEDIKKLKQMKLREQVVETQQNLPLRLRIFEKFPDHPQMVCLGRTSSDFVTTRMRDSFLRHFIEQGSEIECATSLLAIDTDDDSQGETAAAVTAGKSSTATPAILPPLLTSCGVQPRQKSLASIAQKKSGVYHIIRETNKQRIVSEDGAQVITAGTKSLLSKQHQVRMDRRSVRSRPDSMKNHYQATRDNGAVRRMSSNRKTDDFDIKILQQKKQEAKVKRKQQEENLRENHPYFDTPLFAMGRDSRFRKICKTIVTAQYQYSKKDMVTGKDIERKYQQLHELLGLVTYLDWVMIIVTILSCMSMMLETPTRRVMNDHTLQIAEYAFVICMSIEMTLKVLADGLFFTPQALVRDFNGVLDLFIYAVSLVFLCWMPNSVSTNSSAHLLMILRCLRPLRIFILVPHMRRVVYELIRSGKEILLVSVLLIVLMFVFASYGVQLFGGKLSRCNDRTIKTKGKCNGIFARPIFVTKLNIDTGPESADYPKIFVPRVWANPRNFNFDNIGNAMLALFEVLSLEGWLEVRDVIIERVGPTHAIFIHMFVFIGCMIGLTLFVGVMIASYMENKGTALLTVDQKRWLDLMGRIKLAQPLHIPPRPDGNQLRAIMYDITQNLLFKRGVAVLVLANCSLLSVPWITNKSYTYALATISAIFTSLFLIEVVMKMIALSPAGYWQSRRNRFDMFVTILGVIWIFMHFTLKANDLSNPFGYTTIVLRFFTITGKHATLKTLMLTVVVSMFKSFFIIMGMFLLMLCYAFAGVILFGCVKYGEDLGRHANFEMASNAVALLFRIVTGEDWNKIMHDCMITEPYCTGGHNFWESDCGNSTVALVFFCSFYVIITYIILNLLVAIIMENFSLFYSNEEDALLSYNDIRQFQNTWNMVDVNRKCVIAVRRVKFVLRLLKGRLEVDLERDRLLFKHMCYEIERLRNGDDVTFHDALSMLAYRSVDIRKSLQLEELLAREELEYTIEEEVAKQTIRHWLDKCLKRIRAKEHSNIITNLKATNEPLLNLCDRIPSIVTEKDDENENNIAADSNTRQRRKAVVERNLSAPLPGMLQAPMPSRQFLSPTLSDGAVRADKAANMASGLKKRSSVRLQSSVKNLANVSECEENFSPTSPGGATTHVPSTTSGLGTRHSTSQVHTWWKSQNSCLARKTKPAESSDTSA